MNSLPERRFAMLRQWSLVAACAVAALAAGCGDDKGKPATQVAAKVNNEEISVHQVDFLLQRQGEVNPEDARRLGHEALDRLIDQEVTLQKAMEMSVDRDPQVMRAIDSARREIIARAYLDHMTASVARPTPQEIKQYYAARPLLFGQRQIYDLHELSVEATPQQLAEVQPQLTATKSAGEAVTLLKDTKMRTELRQTSAAPEVLPTALLEKLAVLGKGKAMVLTAPGGAKVVYVTEVRPAPVTEAEAAPKIERFLMNERKRQMSEQDIKSLRAAAKIEYLGVFAQDAGATTQGAAQ